MTVSISGLGVEVKKFSDGNVSTVNTTYTLRSSYSFAEGGMGAGLAGGSVKNAKVVSPALLQKLKGEGREQVVQRVLQSMEANLNSSFASSGVFNMLSRKNLDAVIKEQSLADSGNADVNDGNAQLGKLAKGKYVFSLSVTDFQDYVEKANFTKLERNVEVRIIRMGAVAEITDATTGSIISAPNVVIEERVMSDQENFKLVNGNLNDAVINSVAKKMADTIANTASESLFPPIVLDITGGLATISCGANAGVKVGDVFIIYAQKRKTDRRTDKTFFVEIPVSKLHIKTVSADTSNGETFENLGASEDMIARKVQNQ